MATLADRFAHRDAERFVGRAAELALFDELLVDDPLDQSRAIVLNVLSVGATWGVLALVWQEGHGSSQRSTFPPPEAGADALAPTCQLLASRSWCLDMAMNPA